MVGALGVYPLIKQAMNQGFEAVASIRGRAVVPADQPLPEKKLAAMLQVYPVPGDVDGVLKLVGSSMPWLQSLSALQLRGLMRDSAIRLPRRDAVIFRRNDCSNPFFSIVRGQARIKGQ